MPRPVRVFLEASPLFSFFGGAKTFTGIQRVQVSLLHELAKLAGSDRIWLSWLDSQSGNYLSLPLQALEGVDIRDIDRFKEQVLPIVLPPSVFPPLASHKSGSLKARYHAMRFAVFSALGREKSFTKRGTSIAAWRAWRKSDAARAEVGVSAKRFEDVADPVRDKLLIMDLTWNAKGADVAIGVLHKRGFHVVTLIHDAIPLVMPGAVPAVVVKQFSDWLDMLRHQTSQWVAISQATRRDLAEQLARLGTQAAIDVLPLAQAAVPNVASNRAAAASLRPEVLALRDKDFALCVGTLEPRKNGPRAVEAWERAVQGLERAAKPKLVFAGKLGADTPGFPGHRKALSNLPENVVHIEGPSDAELDFLYRHCRFTTMPSLYEGWGLPVGESLSYGKTAVISNSSSLPEVGGDLVLYCDPLETGSMAEAFRRMLTEPGLRDRLEARIAAADLRSWSDVAGDLLRLLGAIGKNGQTTRS